MVQQCLSIQTILIQQNVHCDTCRDFVKLPEAIETCLEFETMILAEHCLQNQRKTCQADTKCADNANANKATNGAKNEDNNLFQADKHFASANAAESTTLQNLTETNHQLNQQLSNFTMENILTCNNSTTPTQNNHLHWCINHRSEYVN